jgi:hypothetical protein
MITANHKQIKKLPFEKIVPFRFTFCGFFQAFQYEDERTDRDCIDSYLIDKEGICQDILMPVCGCDLKTSGNANESSISGFKP